MGRKVVVIGGGMIGLCSAWYLSGRGYEVTVVDQGDLPGGCSVGNAGFVCPSHVVPLSAPGMVWKGLAMLTDQKSPFYIRPRWDADLWRWLWLFARHANHRHLLATRAVLGRICRQSQEACEEILSQTGIDAGYTRKGLLMACRTAASLAKEAGEADHALAVGLEAKVLTPAQIREMDPEWEMDLQGGVWYPGDTHLHPGRFLTGLIPHLKDRGVWIRTRWPVRSFLTDSRRLVGLRSDADEIRCDAVVLSAGTGSGDLGRQLGIRLPVQGAKGYSFTLADPPQNPDYPFILSDAKVAVTPMAGALRFAGTLELSGTDMSIHPARTARILQVVRESLPAYRNHDFSGITPWVGLRPCSPDGLPYVGRWPGWENLVVATGHAMLGMTLGAGTGQVVATILNGEDPDPAWAACRPDRFAG